MIIRETLIDLISISRVVFTDGVLSLQIMCGAFIEQVSSDLNPAIQEWMRSVAIRHLNEYINNNNTEQSPNTESYIVRSDSESSDSVDDNKDVTVEDETIEFVDARSDIDDKPTMNSTSESNTSDQMEDSTQEGSVSNQVEFELPAVVIGSEPWHSAVPSDWVSNHLSFANLFLIDSKFILGSNYY